MRSNLQRALALLVLLALAWRAVETARERWHWLAALGFGERAAIVRADFGARAAAALGGQVAVFDLLRDHLGPGEDVVLFAPGGAGAALALDVATRQLRALLFPARVRSCVGPAELAAMLQDAAAAGALVARLGGPPALPGEAGLQPIAASGGTTLFRAGGAR